MAWQRLWWSFVGRLACLVLPLCGLMAPVSVASAPLSASQAVAPFTGAAPLRRSAVDDHPVVLILFSLPDCKYCTQVKQQYLRFVEKDPRWAGQVLVREVDFSHSASSHNTFEWLDGRRLTPQQLAAQSGVKVAPTVMLFNSAGQRLGSPIVGASIPEFYGAYVDAAVEKAIDANAQRLRPVEVADHVWGFFGDSGPASSANRGFNSNAAFVELDQGIIVFDVLGTPSLGQAMLPAIRSISRKPVRWVVISHYHADHFYGLSGLLNALRLEGQPAPQIIAHQNAMLYLNNVIAQERLSQRSAALGIDEAQMSEILVKPSVLLTFNQAGMPADQALIDGIPASQAVILDMSGSHAPDDVMLWLPGSKTLLAGDLFFTGRIPYVGDSNSKRWVERLQRLSDLPALVAMPGHGKPSTQVGPDIQLTLNYLTYLRASMGKAVTDLISFDDAYAATDWTTYQALPAFAAANRVNANAVYLQMESESLGR